MPICVAFIYAINDLMREVIANMQILKLARAFTYAT